MPRSLWLCHCAIELLCYQSPDMSAVVRDHAYNTVKLTPQASKPDIILFPSSFISGNSSVRYNTLPCFLFSITVKEL